MISATSPIVLVDDDPLYSEVLAADLGDRGFTVHAFSDGESFLTAMADGLEARLALLDWTLGGQSGLDVLQALSGRGFDLPVVFLTGRSPVERELVALRNGAIDFVDKARGIEVLAPRLRLLFGASRVEAEPAHHGDLVLHTGTARVEWRGRDVGLTVTEYKVVSLLVAAGGVPVAFRTIYDEMHYKGFIGGSGERGFEVNVRSTVRRIRRKFHAIDGGFAHIRSTPGLGYSWEAAPQDGQGAPADDDTPKHTM